MDRRDVAKLIADYLKWSDDIAYADALRSGSISDAAVSVRARSGEQFLILVEGGGKHAETSPQGAPAG